MDELTLLREAHHVDPPDPDLVQRERAALSARIAAEQLDNRRRRRRPRRVPFLVGAAAVIGLAGVGAVAARGLLDDNTATLVESTDCDINRDNGQLVTTATDSRGDTIELWIFDSAAGWGDFIVEKAPDGTWLGSSGGCSPETRDNSDYGNNDHGNGRPWAVAPMNTDSEATLVRLYGWIPAPATTAIVALSDGTTVTAQAGPDGYYLHPVTIAPTSDLDIASVQAITPDGTIIATNP